MRSRYVTVPVTWAALPALSPPRPQPPVHTASKITAFAWRVIAASLLRLLGPVARSETRCETGASVTPVPVFEEPPAGRGEREVRRTTPPSRLVLGRVRWRSPNSSRDELRSILRHFATSRPGTSCTAKQLVLERVVDRYRE